MKISKIAQKQIDKQKKTENAPPMKIGLFLNTCFQIRQKKKNVEFG